MQHVDDDSEHDGDGWGQSLLLLTSSPVALERYSSAISTCVNNLIEICPSRLGRQDGQGCPGTTLVAQVPAPCFQATAGRQAGKQAGSQAGAIAEATAAGAVTAVTAAGSC